MSRFLFLSSIGACFLANVIGCGGKPVDPNRPKTVPATVTVTYKGAPVEGASVSFQTTEQGKRGAQARTDAAGKAAMWTFDPGDGVIPGTYKVTATKTEAAAAAPDADTDPKGYEEYIKSGKGDQPPKHLLPKKYMTAQSTDLEVQVKEGGENNFNLELKD